MPPSAIFRTNLKWYSSVNSVVSMGTSDGDYDPESVELQ